MALWRYDIINMNFLSLKRIRSLDMSEPSKAERAELLEQRLQAMRALLANAKDPAHRPSKPIAMTLRLDAARYARLSTHAARYTPRRSFQKLITEALDAYLGE